MITSKQVRIRPITEREKLFIGQKEMLLNHFKIYPTGILSEVMDTWDLWQVLTELLPDPEIKAAILARDGKLVIRPDSGDPVDIICGLNTRFNTTFKDAHGKELPDNKGVIELLWDVFGGKINEYGYKELDTHIGAIYGDSITLDRAKSICERLKVKGFASTNIVFGVGSYTYQYNTRDTFGFAVKATYGEIETICNDSNGRPHIVQEPREIFKDPITDDGTKKSLKGLLRVGEGPNGWIVQDQCTWGEESISYLETVFEDGKLIREQTLDEIRSLLKQ